MQCELSVSGIQESPSIAVPFRAFAPESVRQAAPVETVRPVAPGVVVDAGLKRIFGLFATGIVATLAAMGTLAYTAF